MQQAVLEMILYISRHRKALPGSDSLQECSSVSNGQAQMTHRHIADICCAAGAGSSGGGGRHGAEHPLHGQAQR